MKTINIYIALLILSTSANAVSQRTTPQIVAKTENHEQQNTNNGSQSTNNSQNQQMMKKVEVNLKKYETEMQKKQLAYNSPIKQVNTKSESLNSADNEKANNLDNTIKTKTIANELPSTKSDGKSISKADKQTNIKPVENELSSEKSESQLVSNNLAFSTKKPKEKTNTIIVKIKKTVECVKLVQWVLIDEKSEILMQKSLNDQEVSIFSIDTHKSLNIRYDTSLPSQPKYVLLKWEDSQCAIENPSPNRAKIIPTDMWDIDAKDFLGSKMVIVK